MQTYGYPDWDMVRWFESEYEKVVQVPVLLDEDCETRAVILCAENAGKLKFWLFERGKFDIYENNIKPAPTVEKIKDLFIIFDFQRFGVSNYLPEGRIVNADEKSGQLKSASSELMMISTCYELEAYVDGRLVSKRYECETKYIWVDVDQGLTDPGDPGGGMSENNQFNIDSRPWYSPNTWTNENNTDSESGSAAIRMQL